MKKIMFIILIVVIFIVPVLAETVTLKSGRVIEGEIIEKTDEYVKIDTGKQEMKIKFRMMDQGSASRFKDMAIKKEREQFFNNNDESLEEYIIKVLSQGVDERGDFNPEKLISDLEKESVFANEEMVNSKIKTIGRAIEYYYADKNIYPENLNKLKENESSYTYSDYSKPIRGYQYKLKNGGSDSYFIVAYPVSISILRLREKYVGRYSFCLLSGGIVRARKNRDPIESYEVCKGLEKFDDLRGSSSQDMEIADRIVAREQEIMDETKMQEIKKKVEKQIGPFETVSDRMSATNRITILAASIEIYATSNNGVYPTNANELEMEENYCGKIVQGYSYICNLRPDGYDFSAIPEGGDESSDGYMLYNSEKGWIKKGNE